MELRLGRGLVKHRPQSWHCTTANHSPPLPGVGSGASTTIDQRRPSQSRQLHSSHSTTGGEASTAASRSDGKKPIRGIPPTPADTLPAGGLYWAAVPGSSAG